MNPITKKITSDHQDEASYTIIPWGGGYGIRMMRKLTPIVSKVLPIIDQFKGSEGIKHLAEKGLDAEIDIEGLLLEVAGDAANAISIILSSVAQAIAEEGDDMLFREILKDVIRVCNGKALKVGQEHGFNQAYQANYGELLKVTIAILKINYGPALSFLGGIGKK